MEIPSRASWAGLALSADRPPARPRPDRQRRAALPHRMGAGRPDRARRRSRSSSAVPTVFLTRMCSLHDLTHNSMFESRRANSSWGHLLGFLLFTPYRWWQRQHSIHHAHTGDLDHRGVGEINTMTLDEYESLPSAAAGVPPLPQPLLMLLVGPSLVFMFERRFPQRGMTRTILLSVVLTNLALVAWGLGWSAGGLGTFLLSRADHWWPAEQSPPGCSIQHQYEDTYYRVPASGGSSWPRFRASCLAAAALAWVVGNANYHHVHHLSAKIPLPPPRRAGHHQFRHPGRHAPQQHWGVPAEAVTLTTGAWSPFPARRPRSRRRLRGRETLRRTKPA